MWAYTQDIGKGNIITLILHPNFDNIEEAIKNSNKIRWWVENNTEEMQNLNKMLASENKADRMFAFDIITNLANSTK